MLIYDLTYSLLEEKITNAGFKKYRAAQIWDFLYRKFVKSFEQMTNLPKEVISFLTENFNIRDLELKETFISEDKTVKYLYQLNDESLIETVIMEHPYGNSICVTTEVGCNMGCLFCASGKLKKIRDLTSGEMVLEVIASIRNSDKKISSIVIMGIGEPFDNFSNLVNFLNIVNDPKGLSIGSRHITVSTSGIVPKIDLFSKIPLQVNLAISLHASTDIKRDKLMPINKLYNMKALKEAIIRYNDVTRKRVAIEYVLISGVNDSEEDALLLLSYLKGLNIYVNLIPYNEIKELDFIRSSLHERRVFFDLLKKGGIDVILRREKGHDISAACGQLRSNNIKR